MFFFVLFFVKSSQDSNHLTTLVTEQNHTMPYGDQQKFHNPWNMISWCMSTKVIMFHISLKREECKIACFSCQAGNLLCMSQDKIVTQSSGSSSRLASSEAHYPYTQLVLLVNPIIAFVTAKMRKTERKDIGR